VSNDGVCVHQPYFGESYDHQTWNDAEFGHGMQRGRHFGMQSGRHYGILFDYDTLLYIVKRKYYFPKGLL
jgi:hypothetical protein